MPDPIYALGGVPKYADMTVTITYEHPLYFGYHPAPIERRFIVKKLSDKEWQWVQVARSYQFEDEPVSNSTTD
jgi:hypothetical protein